MHKGSVFKGGCLLSLSSSRALCVSPFDFMALEVTCMHPFLCKGRDVPRAERCAPLLFLGGGQEVFPSLRDPGRRWPRRCRVMLAGPVPFKERSVAEVSKPRVNTTTSSWWYPSPAAAIPKPPGTTISKMPPRKSPGPSVLAVHTSSSCMEVWATAQNRLAVQVYIHPRVCRHTGPPLAGSRAPPGGYYGIYSHNNGGSWQTQENWFPKEETNSRVKEETAKKWWSMVTELQGRAGIRSCRTAVDQGRLTATVLQSLRKSWSGANFNSF